MCVCVYIPVYWKREFSFSFQIICCCCEAMLFIFNVETLYTPTVLNWCILVVFNVIFGLSINKIISSANSKNLASLFPVSMCLISFYWLIFLARISGTVLNKSDANRHPCLILPTHYVVGCRLITYGPCYVRVCSFCNCFLQRLCYEGMLAFTKYLLCMHWVGYMIFVLFNGYWMLNHLWNEFYLAMVHTYSL